MDRNDIWTFKYGPKTFDELILEENTKKLMEPLLNSPKNAIIYGKAGIGKGSFVEILLKKTGADFIKINGCDENSVEVFREKIRSFGTTMSMMGVPKILYINEAERLLENSAAWKPLKDFIEVVQKNCRFIFLLNEFSVVPDEIKSRCQIYEFLPPPIEEIGKLCLKILKSEKISINTTSLKVIIQKCYPDIRWTINTLQQNCIDGELISTPRFSDDVYKEIFDLIKKGDIDGIRSILRIKCIDYNILYKYLFENVEDFKKTGDAVIEIGERLYRNSMVSIKEINFIAGVLTMMKYDMI